MQNEDRCYKKEELNEELLKKFSEGSEALEKLLILCYKNNIETIACCIGHKEKGKNSKPYILFTITDEQQTLMENVINDLLNRDKFSKNVHIELEKQEKIKVTFRYDYKGEIIRDVFFNLIRKNLYEAICFGKNEPGIYNGLIEAFKKVNNEKQVEFYLESNGIKAVELKTTYFKIENGIRVVTDKENSEFSMGMPVDSCILPKEQIESFIAYKNNQNPHVKRYY